LDNTSKHELDLWLGHIRIIKPELVMIYPIERETAESGIEKIGKEELNRIAALLKPFEIPTEVFA
jgi:hypothetical protein